MNVPTGSVDTAESWLCEAGVNSIDDFSKNYLIAVELSGGGIPANFEACSSDQHCWAPIGLRTRNRSRV